ncbi:Histidinol-phosphate aminotransferase [Photobacterium marinum]|uniref:histidinol-phosphate transaminase n=1 Tax=Photobacterium marinum TaxID=1056511 RepID=L8J4L1_9GAMM|nr:histidinol-phosphate transaminase [Photobacterium marinum]ELR63770.1 Histidinol-phosphate aminotransferase [Photobacterium marinum]
MFFNKFIRSLNPYKVSSHKAWDYTSDPHMLKLDWNEATIQPTPLVSKYISEFLSTGRLNWYPNVDNTELRLAIAEYVGQSIDCVEYFASSDALHEYIIRTFIYPGDKVAMIGPTYDNFRAAAQSVGADIVHFKLSKDTKFTFNKDNFTYFMNKEMPKIVYLCNPNNPTGNVYNYNLIEQLLRKYNDVLFVIDEAYYEFTEITASDLVEKFDNIVICRTFSKAFALASFRIGYAISSRHNIEGLRKVRNPKNISSCSQLAALAALHDISYTRQYVQEVNESKLWLVDRLKDMGLNVLGYEGGNFVFVDFGEKNREIIQKLENHKIFIRSYAHVDDMETYSRISVGTLSQMTIFLNVLVDVLDEIA